MFCTKSKLFNSFLQEAACCKRHALKVDCGIDNAIGQISSTPVERDDDTEITGWCHFSYLFEGVYKPHNVYETCQFMLN